MRLYHRTRNGDEIVRSGFRDGIGNYLTSTQHVGVWVSDVPLDENEGASGDNLFVIDIAPELLGAYEWVEEGRGFREWLVPAALLNETANVRLLTAEEAEEAMAAAWRGGAPDGTPPRQL